MRYIVNTVHLDAQSRGRTAWIGACLIVVASVRSCLCVCLHVGGVRSRTRVRLCGAQGRAARPRRLCALHGRALLCAPQSRAQGRAAGPRRLAHRKAVHCFAAPQGRAQGRAAGPRRLCADCRRSRGTCAHARARAHACACVSCARARTRTSKPAPARKRTQARTHAQT